MAQVEKKAFLGADALSGMKSKLAAAARDKKKVSAPAKTESTDTATAGLQSIPLADIRSKPQVRKNFQHIEELAESIKQEGLKQPIVVGEKGDDGKHVIQQGERRYRACNHLGLEAIDCVVRPFPLDETDIITGELVENIQRDDLTALEIAEALGTLVERDLKQVDIARRLGKSKQWVGKYVALHRAPEPVKELYDADITKDLELAPIMTSIAEYSMERVEQMCSAAIEDGITRAAAKMALEDEQRKAGAISRDAEEPGKVSPGRQEPERNEGGTGTTTLEESDEEQQEIFFGENGGSGDQNGSDKKGGESTSGIVLENAIGAGEYEPSMSPNEEGRQTHHIPSQNGHDVASIPRDGLPVIEVSAVLGNSEAWGILDITTPGDSPEKCWVEFTGDGKKKVSRRQVNLEDVALRCIQYPGATKEGENGAEAAIAQRENGEENIEEGMET
jgi:ParB family chromosome partitioning protein